MMATEKYNGYKNYETWAVALWLDNEESTHNYWREAAQEVLERATDGESGPTKEEREDAIGTLADRLKNELEDEMPDLGASFWADMLNAAFSEIYWYEVAEQFFEE